MKHLFDKDNFIFNHLNRSNKMISLFISIILIVSFIFASFSFFNALYCLCNVVGSIVCKSFDVALRDLVRTVPILLSFLISLWFLLIMNKLYMYSSDEAWRNNVKRKSYTLLSISIFNIVYIVVLLINKKFLSIIEGGPTPVYPLDALIYSILFVIIAILLVLFTYKGYRLDISLERNSGVTKSNKTKSIFYAIWLLVSLFGFAGGVLGMFIYDLRHEYAFYGIMSIIIYLLTPLYLGFYEFYYYGLKSEKRKDYLLSISIIAIIISSIVTILYFVSLSINLDAPSNGGFGIFPIAFTASLNVETLLIPLAPIVVSIVLLIKAIKVKVRK